MRCIATLLLALSSSLAAQTVDPANHIWLLDGTTASSPGGGAGTPGGADTQVQFNDAGSFEGDEDFTWIKATQVFSLGLVDASTRLLLPFSNDAATPTLGFGDGDSGIFEASDDHLEFSMAGAAVWHMNATQFGSEAATGPHILHETATVTNPVYTLNGDPDTGLGGDGLDTTALVAGGVEALRATETGGNVTVGIGPTTSTAELMVSGSRSGFPPLRIQHTLGTADGWSGIEYMDEAGGVTVFTGANNSTNEFRFNNVGTSGFVNFMIGSVSKLVVNNDGTVAFGGPIIYDLDAGVTASVTQTQGQNPITAAYVEVSTVANAGDVCGTLPAAVAGLRIIIINNGTNECQIFPASGDDIGAGVDTALTLPANKVSVCVAYDATNWTAEGEATVSHGTMLDETNTDAYVVNDTGADFHSYHTNALAAGQSAGWTFDAGGGGTSFPIASVADSAGSPGSQILVTTTGSHGLAVNDIISQTNLADAAYVGIFEVVATAAATTYEVAAVFTATGTGTMDQAATMECGTGASGDYHITWHATATSATNNETFDFVLYQGTTTVPGSWVTRKFGTAADFGSFSGGGISAVTCGDKISLALSNQDTAGNLTIRHLTIIAERL